MTAVHGLALTRQMFSPRSALMKLLLPAFDLADHDEAEWLAEVLHLPTRPWRPRRCQTDDKFVD